MKLNEELYAVVMPDGTLCGDGNAALICYSREYADAQAANGYIKRINDCDNLRVVKVKIVEVK